MPNCSPVSIRRALLLGLTLLMVACSSEPVQTTSNQGQTDAGSDVAADSHNGGEPDQCYPDQSPCGDDCCSEGEICQAGQCQLEETCPANQSECAGSCCSGDEVCEDDQCLPSCDGERCGADLEMCCSGDDICFGDGCVTPGDTCERTEECDIGELCEPSLGQCLSRDEIAVCEYRPPTGEFSPDVGCTWVSDDLNERPGRGDIVATPLVANLTDDNGDGVTNVDDIPNIVFPSFNRNGQSCCNEPSTLRILHGDCREDETLETIASISEPAINNDSGMALADLNHNGVPEIIGVTNIDGQPRGTVAFTRTADDGSQWDVLWHNEEYPQFNTHTRGGATVSVADLNGDGDPEVIIGNLVLNGQDGALKWDGVETSGGDGGIGNNAFLGPSSVVADITLDGTQEVIAGNTAYDHEGNVLWTYEFTSASSGCHGALPCDGYAAVASFTDDPHPNVVIVRRGDVYILDHQGELVWEQELPWEDCTRNDEPANESGPPTVADFNGDGSIEIGTAGADFYSIAKMECDVDDWEEQGCAERGILWKTAIQDCSSRATASSVFDFHGDGRAEVVYADEVAFRIYDGTSGEVVFEDDRHQSNTRIEMPIIADINNDGRAEVLVASAYADRGDRPGLWLWKDTDGHWVRTRRIWNQHAYHVTNIEEDGTVPSPPEYNWDNPRLNNFRQNVQPDGLFDAPDLVLRNIENNTTPIGCANQGLLTVEVEVSNEGALGVPAGVAVDVELVNGDDVVEQKRVHTTERLLPGHFESFELSFQIDSALFGTHLDVHAVIDPDEEVNECNEDNNDFSLTEIICTVEG